MPPFMLHIFLVYLSFVSPNYARFILHERRDDNATPGGFNRRRVGPDVLLPMRIGLRENEHARENAEKWLMEISSPDSPLFGQHWTQEQVISAFKPSSDTIGNVSSWLGSYGIFRFTHSDNKLWFAFDLQASKAEQM